MKRFYRRSNEKLGIPGRRWCYNSRRMKRNETKRNERTNERANKRKGSRWTRGLLPPGSRAKIVNSRDSRVIGGMCFQSVVERIRKGKAEQEKERRRQVVGVPEIPVTEPKPFY